MRHGNCSPSDGWHDIILGIVNCFEEAHIIHHLLKLSYRRYITLLLFDNKDTLFLITCWHKNHTPQKVLTRQFWPRQREGLIAYCKIKLYTTQAFENSLLHEQISLCSTVISIQSCIHEWYQLFSVQSSAACRAYSYEYTRHWRHLHNVHKHTSIYVRSKVTYAPADI